MMKAFRNWYRRNFMVIELFAALVVTIAVWFTISYFCGQPIVQEMLRGSRQMLYATIASIGGSLLGFVLTAVSVVIVFGQLPKLRILRESTQYVEVFNIFFQAVGWLAMTTLWAFVGLLIDKDSSPVLFITYGMLFLSLVCIARLYRCIWIMKAITELAVKKPVA